MILSWKVCSGVEDAETVEDCLRRFKQCYKERQLPIKDIRKSSAVIRFALQSHYPSPNNLQVAKAQAACHLIDRYGRQIWQIPGGQGKLLIFATIALMLLKSDSGVQRVHLVFSNELLKEKDKQAFENLYLLANVEDQVEYQVGLDFEMGTEDVLVIDEGDVWIYEDPNKFDRLTAKTKLIALSGSTRDTQLDGIEHDVLKKLGFKIFDQISQEYPMEQRKPEWERIKLKDDQAILEFVRSER